MLAQAARRALIAVIAAGVSFSATLAAEGDPAADYPTNARADYVFGCMAGNGQTREALERCSCSLDIVASILPYDRYVQAETILRMRQGVGQQASIFRSTKMFDDIVADLRRAQAEAEIRCFR
jgi:hypothetical protein